MTEVYDFRSAYPKMTDGFQHLQQPSLRRCKLAPKFVEDLAKGEPATSSRYREIVANSARDSGSLEDVNSRRTAFVLVAHGLDGLFLVGLPPDVVAEGMKGCKDCGARILPTRVVWTWANHASWSCACCHGAGGRDRHFLTVAGVGRHRVFCQSCGDALEKNREGMMAPELPPCPHHNLSDYGKVRKQTQEDQALAAIERSYPGETVNDLGARLTRAVAAYDDVRDRYNAHQVKNRELTEECARLLVEQEAIRRAIERVSKRDERERSLSRQRSLSRRVLAEREAMLSVQSAELETLAKRYSR